MGRLKRKLMRFWKQIPSPTLRPWVPLSRRWRMNSSVRKRLQNNADLWTSFSTIKLLRDVIKLKRSFRGLIWATTKQLSKNNSKNLKTIETRNWFHISKGISGIHSARNPRLKRRNISNKLKIRCWSKVLNNKLRRKINLGFKERRKTKKSLTNSSNLWTLSQSSNTNE